MEKARLGEVPVVDLKCATCDLASEVGQALKRFGFFYVSNHGIPQELLTSQLEQNRRLFDLPDQVKRSMAFNVTLDIGYTGGTGTSQALDPNAGIQAADTKEGFMLTNNAFMGAAALDPTNPRKFLPRHPHLDPKDPLAGATLHWPPAFPATSASFARTLPLPTSSTIGSMISSSRHSAWMPTSATASARPPSAC